jgi:phosphatidylglycerol lysyltransferase
LANAHQAAAGSAVEDRSVRFLYENLNHVYAYKPLFEFKRKYRPEWRARYLAYPTGESLPLIGLALVRVHTRQNPWRFLTG